MATNSISRLFRTRGRSDSVLGAAHTIAELTTGVTDILNIPIASHAASLVLSLLEVAKVSSQ